jgi:hypothetical protein
MSPKTSAAIPQELHRGALLLPQEREVYCLIKIGKVSLCVADRGYAVVYVGNTCFDCPFGWTSSGEYCYTNRPRP